MKVIILNWNCYADTIECVESLLQSGDVNLNDIIVVDNASSDDSINKIKDRYGEITLIGSERNLGYAGGNNVGIKSLPDDNFDDILICNPDVRVTPGCIKKMKEALAKENVGMVGPKIKYRTDGKETNIIWGIGGPIDVSRGDTPMLGYKETDIGQFDSDLELDRLTGACLFIKNKLIKSVGVLPEDYFLYFEESDYCIKARQAGFKLLYIADAKAYHEGSATMKHDSAMKRYYFNRSRIRFVNNNGSFMEKIFFFIYFSIEQIKRSSFLLFKGEWKLVIGTIFGTIDFFLGKREEAPKWVINL